MQNYEMNQSIHHILKQCNHSVYYNVLLFYQKLILIKLKILKKKKPPVVNFLNSNCKIPLFFPDFLIFIKFPDFSIQWFFFSSFSLFSRVCGHPVYWNDML